jgi:hypothetical protein
MLEIPYPKLLEAHQNTEAKMKYGKTALQSLKLSPELYEFDELIRALTKDQREMVINHMRSLAAGNARQAVAPQRKTKYAHRSDLPERTDG